LLIEHPIAIRQLKEENNGGHVCTGATLGRSCPKGPRRMHYSAP
jgi:hypothetical protein